jgi:asparagine synthase (glutamine-hydrolysing)
MCGLNGFTWKDTALAERMNAVTKYRGPDRTRAVSLSGVTFGFNRLAIIDLDERAMQPLADASGRYTLIFNGEIYNFKELKKELAGYPWKTEGDSEVILAAYAQWGSSAFSRFNGMFALALWDEQKKELVLARDSSGIKPLLYTQVNGQLVFSSDISALFEAGVPRIFNTQALGHYLRLKYAPAPMTMVQGVQQLLPGHMLVWREDKATLSRFANWQKTNAPTTYAEAKEMVRKEVSGAVTRQLVSDRPIGLYLSGGIDSSVILACASATHPAINTFSVGFDLTDGEEREKFNVDAVLAKKSAEHFGAMHHEYLLSSDDVLSLFPEMLSRMSSPIGNPTALAQLYLAKKTKEQATVVLTGEGGDELFGGYDRYRLALKAQQIARLTPGFIDALLPGSLRTLHARGLKRFAQLMYEKKSEFSQVIMSGVELANTSDLFAEYFTGGDIADELMHADEGGWLVGDALMRGDNMSMAASLEARVPFLDERVKALARALPRSYKVDTSRTKKVLKDAFTDVLPREILQQPKRGWFSPGAKWLRRSDFVAFADEMFAGAKEFEAVFNMQEIRALYAEHRGGGYHATILWSVLTLLAWAREHKLTLT